MNTNSEEYKRQVYKRWLENGQIFYDIDKSKGPSDAERQIILEIKKQENEKVKRELQRRAALPNRVRVNQIKKFDRLIRGEF